MEDKYTQEYLQSLPIEYIKGNSSDFVVFIQGLKDKAELQSIDGHARWLVMRDDGSQYICRPIEAKPNEENFK